MSIRYLKERLRDVPGIETLTMQMLAGRQIYSFVGRVVAVDAAASDAEVMTAIRAAVSSDAIAQIPAGTPVATANSEGAPAAEDFVNPPQAGEASPVSGTSPASIPAASTEGTAGEATLMASPAGAATNTVQGGTATADVTAPSQSASLIPPVNVPASAPVTIQPQAPAMTTPTKPGAHALTVKDVLASHGQKLDQILQAQIAKLQATLNSQVDTVVAGTDAVIAHAESQTAEFQAILGQISNIPTE
ncbi:hypothetical protein [Bradyrhizobium uaiense]|uniref:Uncharacterized protein n=1 Tax=Bradyrhizobium uaiense TaxID=2594946 RepID=A0A6P1B8S7_9BRAD|nr:hypothetical protein [Bradyrhizobium uaiense]NEU94789.1 hypothetical protein [Bradyrhizobium uaiense]